MVLVNICHSDANDFADGDIVVYNNDDRGGENRDHQYTIKVWG